MANSGCVIEYDLKSPLSRVPRDIYGHSAESETAHRALLEYYDLGETRSLPKLCQKLADDASKAKTGKGLKVVTIKTVQTWSCKFAWNARVAQEEVNRSQEALEARRAAHRDRIEQFREQTEQIGSAYLSILVDMLKILKEKAKTLKSEELKSVDFDRWVRTLAAALPVGLEAKAKALGIEQLLNEILERTAGKSDSN